MMPPEYLTPSRSNTRCNALVKLLKPKTLNVLIVGGLILSISACTPNKIEIPTPPPTNLFDYSRSDLPGLIEFANRFGTLPDSAKIAICREMDLSEKEGKNDPRGLTLHQAAAQIFLPSCSAAIALQEKLKALADSSESSADQKLFASLSLQLILRQENQTNALIQAQKKARAKPNGNGTHRKPETLEKEPPAIDDAFKQATPPPIPDDVARKKLEALRNLEKSMDRTLKP